MVGAVERAATLSGRRVRTINVVGGGAQNAMLCQAIADRSALPVVATAPGNVLVQARSLGAVDGDLDSLRELIARTHDLTTYAPSGATEAVR
jgi:rhamnulokinase